MIDKFCVTDEDGAVQFAMTIYEPRGREGRRVEFEFLGELPIQVTEMDVLPEYDSTSLRNRRAFAGDGEWQAQALFDHLKTHEGRALCQKWYAANYPPGHIYAEGEYWPYDYLVKPVESQWGTK